MATPGGYIYSYGIGWGVEEKRRNSASQQCLECISCANQNSWENQAVSWIVVQGTRNGIQSFPFQASGVSPVQDRS